MSVKDKIIFGLLAVLLAGGGYFQWMASDMKTRMDSLNINDKEHLDVIDKEFREGLRQFNLKFEGRGKHIRKAQEDIISNTNLINEKLGSWFFLSEIMLDFELDYNKPFTKDLCGTCTKCIDDCPTDAIIDDYKLDANKCISYLTIEHRDDIPQEFQNKMENWIYGCDICQEVCPWNLKFNQVTPRDDFNPRQEILDWKNIDWENLNELTFKKVFKGSAAKRAKFSGLKRNVIKNSRQRSPK